MLRVDGGRAHTTGTWAGASFARSHSQHKDRRLPCPPERSTYHGGDHVHTRKRVRPFVEKDGDWLDEVLSRKNNRSSCFGVCMRRRRPVSRRWHLRTASRKSRLGLRRKKRNLVACLVQAVPAPDLQRGVHRRSRGPPRLQGELEGTTRSSFRSRRSRSSTQTVLTRLNTSARGISGTEDVRSEASSCFAESSMDTWSAPCKKT